MKPDCTDQHMEFIVVGSFAILYLLKIHIAIVTDETKWSLGNEWQRMLWRWGQRGGHRASEHVPELLMGKSGCW